MRGALVNDTQPLSISSLCLMCSYSVLVVVLSHLTVLSLPEVVVKSERAISITANIK